jgi:preprotein translocase subunit SecA
LEDDLMRLFGSDRIAGYMDRLGMKEGEVIQHSLITKSIERAQKKVEQNNFGIRKRLLEYDDVMNSQREVVYTRRRNALYGERLQVDIQNMLSDLCDSLISQYQSAADFEGLQLEILKVFAAELPFTDKEFLSDKADTLADRLYTHLDEHYHRKNGYMLDNAMQVIEKIYEDKGKQIENIVVPFTDSIKMIQIAANLEKVMATHGKELITELEKNITLSIIDDHWKEHLRELDDLRQSVQNAVFEQKDPLLIYKFESFKLFGEMLGAISRDVLSFIFKGHIEGSDPQDLRNAAPKKQEQKALKTSRDNIYAEANPRQFMEDEEEAPLPKAVPVKVGEKIGRNDPCYCGIGKKFKNCHGKEE